jgi:hypothetical protein
MAAARYGEGMMLSKGLPCLVAATTLLALFAVPSAVATRVTTGLWASDFHATPSDCAEFSGNLSQDGNGFCYIDDNGAVELGVTFTSSEPVNVVGVRVYRTDEGAVTGSLWSSDGTRLAGPTTFGGSATHSWQDVRFSSPVTITPGTTYVASYFAPQSKYAYEYEAFASAYTIGPITALASVSGNQNGVYCYVGEACAGFPTYSYHDTNYWVTPIWAGPYEFTGFFSPVDNGMLNTVKAGQGIPVKFSLGSDEGLNIFAAGYPQSKQIACDSAASADDIEQTVTAGSSGLSYDAVANQYTYVWKTDKTWANTCRQLVVKLDDLTEHVANFKFSK